MPGRTSAIERVSERGLRRRSGRRDEVELLLGLAEHLPEPQRLLVEQVYRHGRPIAELARLTGQPPRRLQRRLQSLVKRLCSGQFRYLAGRGELLPRWVQPIARRRVFEGRSLRDTAKVTGRSLHQVRQAMAHLDAVASRDRDLGL